MVLKVQILIQSHKQNLLIDKNNININSLCYNSNFTTSTKVSIIDNKTKNSLKWIKRIELNAELYFKRWLLKQFLIFSRYKQLQ